MNKQTPKKAVALQYDLEKNTAPIVTAKGSGQLAEKIISEGEKNNIKIQEDKSLVQLIYQLDLNAQIPAALYPVVAEIFALIYHAEAQAGKLRDEG